MNDYIRFYSLYIERIAWGKLSNVLVALHVRFTPNKATEDTFREMILEQIRNNQRKIEFKRWSLFCKMEEIGKKIGVNGQK